MSIRTPRIKIKDCEYTITTLDGDRGLINIGTLGKFLGGPLGQLLAAGITKATHPALIADGIRELAQAFADPEFRELVYELLDGSIVQFKDPSGKVLRWPLIEKGNREVFKGHFAGEQGALLGLIVFAIRENFGNFLDGIPGALAAVAKLKALVKALPSLKATIGESPDLSSPEKLP